MLKSKATGTVSVSLAELFAVLVSVIPAGATIVAVFVMLPLALAATVAATLTVSEPPGGRFTLIPGACRFATVTPEVGQTAPPLADVQLTLPTVRFVTAGSLSSAPFTIDGPALATTMV